ncbi:CtsR family transcriptional regulator [Desulfovirgula thermocuniculi]|uniref:CtsR family transcriptional regulator n=1 Tax=Desulfovirgula thermocuniculi TaxID=348842 RepID=UPI0003FA777F|nr:CtsR family transcriptional regulator [Desulfovirgula thermocuniculi]
MRSIADIIERYLKELLAGSAAGAIEVRRSELAERFDCAPSQINYVLATRFTPAHGFLVESRRGGGGYIRIIKLPLEGSRNPISQLLELVGSEISQERSVGLLERLREERLISEREFRIMRAAVDREVLRLGLPARDRLRALILRAMLQSLLAGS